MVDYPVSVNDVDYLAEEKRVIIDSCKRCHGLDFSCSCYAAYDVEVRKVRARIPLKYRKAETSSIQSPAAAKSRTQIESYIKNIHKYRKSGTGLYLWGSEGTAKTYLGCSVLIAAIRAGYSAYFTTLTDCVDNLIRSRDSFAYILQNTTYLMIDDIGYAYRPIKDEVAYVDSVLDSVIRRRGNSLMPNIVTSHKSVAELSVANQSGTRIASVLKEHTKRIQFSGPNFRDTMHTAK